MGNLRNVRRAPFVGVFLGFRIQERDGVYIAVPLEWARGRGETLAASDLATLLEEIRRWWYQVEA